MTYAYVSLPRETTFMAFMILTFRAREGKSKEILAVVHVDGTTMSQIVEKEIDPTYYRMIKSFEFLSRVSVVLNRSFNIRGEPIVCILMETIRDFYAGGMNVLAIGSYLLVK